MKKSNDDIPQYIIDELAKMMLPEILKFYENDKSKTFPENVISQKNSKDKLK